MRSPPGHIPSGAELRVRSGSNEGGRAVPDKGVDGFLGRLNSPGIAPHRTLGLNPDGDGGVGYLRANVFLAGDGALVAPDLGPGI